MYTFLYTNTTLLFTIFTFLRLNFLTLKSYQSSLDEYTKISFQKQHQYPSIFTYFLFVYALSMLLTTGFSSNWLNLNYSTSLLTLITTTLVLITLVSFQTNKDSLVTPTVVLFLLTNIYLIVTANFVHFYLVLEVTAYLNLLLLSIYGVTFKTTYSNHNISALVISFLMNFITSILLFMYVVTFIWECSYIDWVLLSQCTKTSGFLPLIILLKLGAGPWVLGNIISYQGYPLPYLVVYALVSFGILTPVLLTLLAGTSSHTFVLLSTAVFIYVVSANALRVVTLKQLFSYSTAIVQIYLVLALQL